MLASSRISSTTLLLVRRTVRQRLRVHRNAVWSDDDFSQELVLRLLQLERRPHAANRPPPVVLALDRLAISLHRELTAQRRQAPHVPMDLDRLVDSHTPRSLHAVDDRLDAVLLLARLPKDQQRLLQAIAMYSISEVARQTGQSRSTLHTRLRRLCRGKSI